MIGGLLNCRVPRTAATFTMAREFEEEKKKNYHSHFWHNDFATYVNSLSVAWRREFKRRFLFFFTTTM